MDMLYARYSNPMDLIASYISRGRLGTFIKGFLEAEYDRKKEEAEKEQDWMLWIAYVHSGAGESFNDWKKRIINPESTSGNKKDAEMTDQDIQGIMTRLF